MGRGGGWGRGAGSGNRKGGMIGLCIQGVKEVLFYFICFFCFLFVYVLLVEWCLGKIVERDVLICNSNQRRSIEGER